MTSMPEALDRAVKTGVEINFSPTPHGLIITALRAGMGSRRFLPWGALHASVDPSPVIGAKIEETHAELEREAAAHG